MTQEKEKNKLRGTAGLFARLSLFMNLVEKLVEDRKLHSF
jgi:hypothetical protein